jgi:hypothetical protein
MAEMLSFVFRATVRISQMNVRSFESFLVPVFNFTSKQVNFFFFF